MPRSNLSLARVRELLPPTVGADALSELLFASKAEVEQLDGDRLELSVTPDRLDLLSEGGLAFALQGLSGAASGAPRVRRARSRRPWTIERDASVESIRPVIAAVLVRAPGGRPLDAGTLAEAIRFQEILHASVGRDRRVMSLGIYPARKLASPIRYALEPTASVRFVPLHAAQELSAADFLAGDPMGQRFGSLGRSDDRCLTLRDARGALLSLVPVLNSATAGEATPGERVLLLESTGTRRRAVQEALGLLLVVFVARGWSVEPVPVRSGDALDDDGTALLNPAPIDVPLGVLRAVSGQPWSVGEVRERLGRARLNSRRGKGGLIVLPPPWRPDLTTATDVAEDVVLARELTAEDGVLPSSPTRGRRRPETVFDRRFARALLGLGFQQPHTSVLVAESTVARLPGAAPLRLSNPVSNDLAYLRDRLLLSHLEVLERNTRHGYPQRFAELGPVVVRDPEAEAGAATRHHASLIIAGEGCGFADLASIVDYLLRRLDVGSVREPAELPGTIAGRAARVRVAGETVAEFGELSPELLTALGVPVPAAWAEVDLSALWPLAGGRDTD